MNRVISEFRAWRRWFCSFESENFFDTSRVNARRLSTQRGRKITHQTTVPVALCVNGQTLNLQLEPRVSLLDALREFAGLTGTKKGCNQGACGACTVLVDGQRINSCLALAIQYQNREITTIEGLAASDAVASELHPLQAAFIENDGFQCGYCTPGQLCSAIGMVNEWKAGVPSAVTQNVNGEMEFSDAEISERMSGNLCRCGAYVGIVEAIHQVFDAEAKS